jgi:hypothetical protein
MPQLEAAADLRCRVFDGHVLNARVGRATPQPFDHSGDVIFLAGKVRLNRTIGTISDPPTNPKLARLPLCPSAEEHALHVTGHVDMAADERHHTVLMSGASSAFMPTTL